MDQDRFEELFGVNAGYVESLWQQWRQDPGSVDEEWRRMFEELAGGAGAAAPAAPTAGAQAEEAPPAAGGGAEGGAVSGGSGAAVAPPPDAAAPPPESEDEEWVPLRGIAARIARNMEESLEVPTATSVRTIPVKVLDENRRIVNQHMRDRALGKASYTHFVAFAMVRAVREMPHVQARYEERDGKPWEVRPRHVNLGIAVDVPQPDGTRRLLVPNVKRCEDLDFKAFYEAYQDVVHRARDGELGVEDFRGTTFSLTNPGGMGTEMSVPRLMKGQGLILATGSIGVPVQVRGMSPETLAELAVGPVMTVTSTYDHRIVQGAESALLLKRIEELLDGADGFWDEIFHSLRVPWRPARRQRDQQPRDEEDRVEKQAKVWQLITAYRTRGCQIADLDPLDYHPDLLPSLDPEWYGFTIWDLDREFLTDGMCGRSRMTLREILEVLRETYCRRWTLEYMHVVDRERKHWIRERVEPRRNEEVFDLEHRKRILSRLIRAENFERFLHTRYPGNKRFSLEGADTLIPMLAEILDRVALRGVKRVVIGMSHRGRLNVLANILNKSYRKIFAEFEAVELPGMVEGSGDVKYHLGQKGVYRTPTGDEIEVVLSANPSHLESVDPVVCGMVRAYQDQDGDTERRRTLGILIHGDAAFTGQGVVAETLQMSDLPAFRTGGTIHIVLDNRIGFTAGPEDLYSTYYPTDLAKMIQAPIMHANGDYPEGCLRATHVAVDYQQEFAADVVVDLVCYRRRGHNEGDEPMYTQPLLYKKIQQHPTVREMYTQLLLRRGNMTAEEIEEIARAYDEELKRELEASRQEGTRVEAPETCDLEGEPFDDAGCTDAESPETGVPHERVVEIVERTNAMPEGLVVHPNLLRQLKRREEMVRGERPLDWGCAETVAFGSLVQEGIGIRLEGQDSQRGTFSHRHAVIRDQRTGEQWVPLAHLDPEVRVEFWNSLLSEEAALAYEYGYSVVSRRKLVAWESQFGDFANGAQVPIDQYVASGEAKWGQESDLVILLPHGYDGQGPEHSSARVERWLQLCAEGNLVVANCTTSAQYFHLLRRHFHADERKPLVVFTPKSLLRDPRAMSDVAEFSAGRFREVLPDPTEPEPGRVRRLVFVSGKLYHELATFREENGVEGVALVRLEQLYPFPRAAVARELERYPDAERVWAQEEPRNMGGWEFAEEFFGRLGAALHYAGRPPAASPATGSYARHQVEQHAVHCRALGVTETTHLTA